ncbi:hypothetical protein TEA_020274 [Camellia sinensis var. sinensis]|uniref:SCP domain-containing protein n=1 Tax=Camellia sinensis var. sinensis TaxID=542762 RepID=A0A4S4ED02_CAMSN|nr:hypothetical protein TEA_020274 [Camellia sinensis var. sinensis]
MALSKISLAIVSFMALTMAHHSLAQNSPRDFLAAHNAVRDQIGIKPLAWNNTVAAYAENYAKLRSADCNLQHSNGPYGENIAEGSGEFTAVDAVKMWADEKPKYDHNSNSCVGGDTAGCLHYTQIVWRNTAQIGCARATEGLTVEGILENRSKIKPVILEAWAENRDALIELFGRLRDEWMDNDLATWTGANSAVKAPGAYKHYKPCSGSSNHNQKRNCADAEAASVSERIQRSYRRTGSSSPTPRLWGKEMETRLKGLASGEATPASGSGRTESVVFMEEDEPKEWVAQVEPGVRITEPAAPEPETPAAEVEAKEEKVVEEVAEVVATEEELVVEKKEEPVIEAPKDEVVVEKEEEKPVEAEQKVEAEATAEKTE